MTTSSGRSGKKGVTGRNTGMMQMKPNSRFFPRELKGTKRRLIIQAKNTGIWLSIHHITISGTVLSAMECQDFLCTRYNVSVLNLQRHCDICGTAFGVTYTLSCGTGSLVIARRKKIRIKLLYIA